jgi:flagellar protein FliO/FliZ
MKTFFTLICAAVLVMSAPAYAATMETPWASMMMSLFTVVAVIFALAFLYKKLVLSMPGNKTIKVVSMLQLGAKEKLVVVELNNQQHLIGVTAQQISLLSTLDEPIENSEATETTQSAAFESQLLSFLKQKK